MYEIRLTKKQADVLLQIIGVGIGELGKDARHELGEFVSPVVSGLLEIVPDVRRHYQWLLTTDYPAPR